MVEGALKKPGTEASRFSWHVVSEQGEVRALQADWRALQVSLPWAGLFSSYGWHEAWLSKRTPSVLVIRDHDSHLVGLLPFAAWSGRVAIRAGSWFGFANMPHSDHGGMVIREGWEPDVAAALLEFVEQMPKQVLGVILSNIPTASASLTSFISELTSRQVRVITAGSCRVKRLRSETYYRTTREHLKKSRGLRKDERGLGNLGQLGFVVDRDPSAVIAALPGFLQLHQRRYAVRGAVSPLAVGELGETLPLLVTKLSPDGEAIISSLHLAGHPVAMRLSFLSRGTLHLYATAFDPDFSRFSPGVLHLRALLEWAFEAGVAEVDFGVGSSQHKALAGACDEYELASHYLARGFATAFELRLYRAAQELNRGSGPLGRTLRGLRRAFPYGISTEGHR